MMHLVQIVEANSGFDSCLGAWLEVWADQPTVLVYEDDLELISMT